MKKLLQTILSAGLAAVLCMGLTACGENDSEDLSGEEENLVSDSGENNSEDLSGEEDNLAPDSGESDSEDLSGEEDNLVSDSGENDSEDLFKEAEKLVSEKVTEEEWKAAFASENFENAKVCVKVEQNIVNENGENAYVKFEFTYVIADGMCYASAKFQDEDGYLQGSIPDGYQGEVYFTASKEVKKSTEGTFLFPDVVNKEKTFVKNKEGEWLPVSDFSKADTERSFYSTVSGFLQTDSHGLIYPQEADRLYRDCEYRDDRYVMEKREQHEEWHWEQHNEFKFKDKYAAYVLYSDEQFKVTVTATYGGQSVQLPFEL